MSNHPNHTLYISSAQKHNETKMELCSNFGPQADVPRASSRDRQVRVSFCILRLDNEVFGMLTAANGTILRLIRWSSGSWNSSLTSTKTDCKVFCVQSGGQRKYKAEQLKGMKSSENYSPCSQWRCMRGRPPKFWIRGYAPDVPVLLCFRFTVLLADERARHQRQSA